MSDPIDQLRHELLAAADRLHEAGARRGREHRWRNRVLLLAASVSVTIAAALVFTASWTDSPSFLERAEAALTPPARTILHVKWTKTTISAKPACMVRRGPSEIWIDQLPPNRYRAILRNELSVVDPPLDLDPHGPVVCSRGTTTELGGTLRPNCSARGCEAVRRFVPPNTLKVMPVAFGFPVDPAEMFRTALRSGLAHHDGKTVLRGRAVERIRLDPPRCRGCPREPAYVYVDPRSFQPVEMHLPLGGGVRDIMRFTTYEHLSRTAANRALADIRAQHPNARKTWYP